MAPFDVEEILNLSFVFCSDISSRQLCSMLERLFLEAHGNTKVSVDSHFLIQILQFFCSSLKENVFWIHSLSIYAVVVLVERQQISCGVAGERVESSWTLCYWRKCQVDQQGLDSTTDQDVSILEHCCLPTCTRRNKMDCTTAKENNHLVDACGLRRLFLR